ncbi:MAG: glycosyltransferase [Deltaproteobacteria bacterium]|nr:glycosyltransferase [Deltaproteobacteria bacterium]
MARDATFNILMYCHDTFGLGHIRRTMAIANHLRRKNINILILTGSPIVGRFSFPEQIDFVRIPGMIKMTNEEYLPLSIKINARHVLDIRKNIITATAKAFQPQLFIVDKEPLGLKKEILPTLQWLKRCLPKTRTVLGLRDIMDDALTVQTDWREKGVYETLENFYNEIWVYGVKAYYDPIKEYAIPDSISRKMYFTGYIPRKIPDEKAVRQIRKEQGVKDGEKLVVVTTGGGGDGYYVMDAFLSMMESEPRPFPFKTVLITGPFMPRQDRKKAFERARRMGIRTYRFYRWMEKILAAANLVVGMGGYNTVCEVLTQRTPALIIPRETPRREQLIRAKVLQAQGLINYLSWSSLSVESLRKEIFRILNQPEPYYEAMSSFRLTGFDIMSQRLKTIRERKNGHR